ncbi:hypothetical protein BP6252_12501 [Coleophoma cylindrospora]|uniref:Carboxymuconolactone decarboxylase-like domain-containing protein n=1 Tax=Coleophoma cylindrospora TaxID=1849047 RepID=A0A3D8QDA6_9HELO|nr:hypothetical protein BP6252_12501 [Coleophoma cylindrospora]
MTKCTGASRFPPLTPANGSLDAAQALEYEYLVDVTKKVYGNKIVTVDADGAAQGPFNVLLYTPTVAQPWVKLQLAVAGLLTPLESEAAVLGVLSVTKAAYGIYAHSILAEKVGYTPEQVQAMLAGTCPSDITARQGAIHTLAIKLAQTRGPLDMESFESAVSVLGRAGVASAVQQSAAFMYAAMMLNAGDVGVPLGVDAD